MNKNSIKTMVFGKISYKNESFVKSLLLGLAFFMVFGIQAQPNSPVTDSVLEGETAEGMGLESSSQEDLSSLDNVEKIKVTGSRIKRIDLEGLNPVISFSAEDLEGSGYHSVGDFLRDTNVSSFGVLRGKAGTTATGDSYTEINGEPALILINGLRVTKDPEIHEFDLNQVPMNAIERIDVLKGGAGAIYGSDALGGVINFITKKEFSGTQIFGSLTPTLYPVYRGHIKHLKDKTFDDYFAGSEASAGAVFGDSGSNWSYIGSLTARYQENIRMDQRQWTEGLTSGISPFATFISLDDKPLFTNCPADKPCRFDYTPYADLMPNYYQINGFVMGEYKNNDITYYTQVLSGCKRSQYFFAPIPVSAGVKPPLQVEAGHPIEEVRGQAFKLTHRFLEADRRDTPADYFMLDGTVGAKAYLSKIWDYDFSLKGAHIIKNRTSKNLLLRDKTIQAIQEGLYNPLSPTKEGLKDAIYTAQAKTNSSLIFSSLDFSGQAGGFDLATGFQAYFERYSEASDPQARAGNILSNAGSDGEGNRYVGAYYLEAVRSFADALEVQLAWRADYYSDFGLTSFGVREFLDTDNLEFLDYLLGTPKLAFRFQPDSRFLIRGSLGSSFKAPDLSLLYGGDRASFDWLFDTPACVSQIKNLQTLEGEQQAQLEKVKDNEDLIAQIVAYGEDVLEKADLTAEQKTTIEEQGLVEAVSSLYGNTQSCRPTQYYTETSSNKDLNESRVFTASLGSAVELTPDTNLSLDLIYIAKNADPTLAIVDSTGVGKKFLNAEALEGPEALSELDIQAERDAEGKLKNVRSKYLNLSDSQKLFLDLGWNLADIKGLSLAGRTSWTNHFTFFLIDEIEEFPGLGIDSLISDFGRPRWRNSSVLTWKNQDNKHNVSLTALSTAHFKRQSDPSKYFPLYTRFDINYQYQLNEKTSLQVNVYNFLNLGLNFKNTEEDLVSYSLDVPFDPDAWSPDTRSDSDIFGMNGAYFTLKVSHLL